MTLAFQRRHGRASSSITTRTATIKTTLRPTNCSRCCSTSPTPSSGARSWRGCAKPDFLTPVGLRTISTADSWYFPSHGFGLLGGVWPDLTLWFAVALARNGSIDACAHWLEAIYAAMEDGAPRNAVPGQFAEWFDGGSLTNRGMYMSPWTGAKYLWAVAETVCGIDGYRTSGRPHLAPLVPAGWRWAAGVRVRMGRSRRTYVIDVERQTIYGDMREVSAEEPYRCVYAGRDCSDEVTTSPIEVGVVAFEDEAGGAVRAFICNLARRRPRRDAAISAARACGAASPPARSSKWRCTVQPVDHAAFAAAPDVLEAARGGDADGPAQRAFHRAVAGGDRAAGRASPSATGWATAFWAASRAASPIFSTTPLPVATPSPDAAEQPEQLLLEAARGASASRPTRPFPTRASRPSRRRDRLPPRPRRNPVPSRRTAPSRHAAHASAHADRRRPTPRRRCSTRWSSPSQRVSAASESPDRLAAEPSPR